MSKATLKTADKRYSSLDNDYEMTFNSETQMWPCEEEVDLPSVNFNFIPINQLEGHAPQSTVGECLNWEPLNFCEIKYSEIE